MKVGHKTAYQCIRLVLFSSRNTKSPQLIVRLPHYFSKLSPLHVGQLHRWAFFPRLRGLRSMLSDTLLQLPPPPTSLHLWSPIFCFSAANRWQSHSDEFHNWRGIFSYDTPRHVHDSWVFLTSNTDPEARKSSINRSFGRRYILRKFSAKLCSILPPRSAIRCMYMQVIFYSNVISSTFVTINANIA